MRLTGNHVLCEPVAYQQSGLIHLTGKMQFSMELGRPREMRVLDVGPGPLNKKGDRRIPIECEAGDRVIVHSYTEGPLDMADGRCIITGDQIIAVLPQNSATLPPTPTPEKP